MRYRAVLVLLVGACGGSETDSKTASSTLDSGSCLTDTGGGYPTWAGFAEGFFRSQCAACHAADTPDRFGAPESVVFDSEDDVWDQRDAVRRTVLDAGTMPPGGGVLDTEKVELAHYLDCLALTR